jgi:hypothetical protein
MIRKSNRKERLSNSSSKIFHGKGERTETWGQPSSKGYSKIRSFSLGQSGSRGNLGLRIFTRAAAFLNETFQNSRMPCHVESTFDVQKSTASNKLFQLILFFKRDETTISRFCRQTRSEPVLTWTETIVRNRQRFEFVVKNYFKYFIESI